MFKKNKEEETVADAVKKDTETPTQESEEQKDETTIADATETQEEEKKVVAYGKYVRETQALKKEKEELEQRVAELEQQDEVSKQDYKDFVNDFGTEAVDKLSNKLQAEMEDKYGKRLEQLEAERKQEQQRKVLNNLFKTAIENNPEYKGIAKKDVIFKMALDQSNKNKTMSQIIKDTYGAVEEGESKKSMETKTSNSSDTPSEIDFNNFDRLSEEEQLAVLDDPETKAKYNKFVESQLDI